MAPVMSLDNDSTIGGKQQWQLEKILVGDSIESWRRRVWIYSFPENVRFASNAQVSICGSNEQPGSAAGKKLGYPFRSRKYFSPSNFVTLYKAQIGPSLEYCSYIWAAAGPTTLSILDAVQRRAIRLIGDPALTRHLQPLSHRRADKGRWTKIHKALQEHDIPVRKAVNTSQGVKVYPSNISSHRELTRQLDKSEIEFTTFQVSEDRDLSVVLRGVNESSSDQEILDELRVKFPSLVEIRSKNFNEFIEEAENHPSSVWKVTRILRNRKPVLPPLKVGNSTLVLDSEKANAFADSLQSQCTPNPSPSELTELHHKITSEARNFAIPASVINPCSPDEINNLIRRLKNRKAPGGDGISNKKTMFAIEFSAPAEVNIVSKEEEKRTKYQELLGQLRRLWPDYAVSLLVMVIGSLGGMRNTLLSALRVIPVCRAAAHILAARMQKAVILGSLRLLRAHDTRTQ
nr:unnamed protein product [Callosobruchus chinensis]